MKNLLLILVILISLPNVITAQNTQRQNQTANNRGMADYTPEEAATLQTKRMTLLLDLTEKQQAQVQKLFLENATQRQAMREANQAKRQTGEGNKPSKEERFAMQNKRLDNQIAMKAKMKEILTEDQFVKWEKAQMQRKNDFNQNKPNRKNRGNK
jgi:hypothetical protein